MLVCLSEEWISSESLLTWPEFGAVSQTKRLLTLLEMKFYIETIKNFLKMSLKD